MMYEGQKRKEWESRPENKAKSHIRFERYYNKPGAKEQHALVVKKWRQSDRGKETIRKWQEDAENQYPKKSAASRAVRT